MTIKPLSRQDDAVLRAMYPFLALCEETTLYLLERLERARSSAQTDTKTYSRGTKAFGLAMRRLDAINEDIALERQRLAAFVDMKNCVAKELDRRGYPANEYQ